MRYAFHGLVALALAGCVTTEPMLWLRTDGQRIPDNPSLIERARLDETICRGEVARTAELATSAPWQSNIDAVFEGCMAQRGYVLVPERLAEQRRAELIGAHQRK